MKIREMVSMFRQLARDHEDPPLWCDEVIRARLHEGQREAAIRKRLIRDYGNSYSTLHLSAGQSRAAIDPIVISVDFAGLLIDDEFINTIQIVDRETIYEYNPQWRSLAGNPEFIIQDDTAVTIIPSPTVQCKIQMDITRYPEAIDSYAEMEVSAEHHEAIVWYALSVSHLDADSDAYDAQKAKRFEDMFDRRYGPPVHGCARKRVRNTSRRNKLHL